VVHVEASRGRKANRQECLFYQGPTRSFRLGTSEAGKASGPRRKASGTLSYKERTEFSIDRDSRCTALHRYWARDWVECWMARRILRSSRKRVGSPTKKLAARDPAPGANGAR